MTSTTEPIAAPGADDGRMSRREILQALSGLMVGMFVAILASTVVANALPRIIADLNGSQTVYTWIVTSELLAMTATVPLWGKMADLYSKVAASYDAPSAADLDNLRLIRDRFAKATADFEALKPKVKGGDTLTLASFGEFLEMD